MSLFSKNPYLKLEFNMVRSTAPRTSFCLRISLQRDWNLRVRKSVHKKLDVMLNRSDWVKKKKHKKTSISEWRAEYWYTLLRCIYFHLLKGWTMVKKNLKSFFLHIEWAYSDFGYLPEPQASEKPANFLLILEVPREVTNSNVKETQSFQ